MTWISSVLVAPWCLVCEAIPAIRYAVEEEQRGKGPVCLVLGGF